MSISLRAIEMISKMKSKAPTLESKSFLLFTSGCYLKGATSERRNKNVAEVMENSDHDRITSKSCLEKVTDTVETECSKSFTNVALWGDGMGAQF